MWAKDSLREIGNGCVLVDGQCAKTDAGDEDAVGVEGNGDAGQRTASDLIGSENRTAVETGLSGDKDFDIAKISLDEGIVNRDSCGQVFETFAEHAMKEFVNRAEVGPLRADVHLATGTERCGWLGRGFAHHGTVFGLAVDELTDLAADFGVDTEDFCHSYLVFECYGLCWLLASG